MKYFLTIVMFFSASTVFGSKLLDFSGSWKGTLTKHRVTFGKGAPDKIEIEENSQECDITTTATQAKVFCYVNEVATVTEVLTIRGDALFSKNNKKVGSIGQDHLLFRYWDHLIVSDGTHWAPTTATFYNSVRFERTPNPDELRVRFNFLESQLGTEKDWLSVSDKIGVLKRVPSNG